MSDAVILPLVAPGGAGKLEHFMKERSREGPNSCWPRPSSTFEPFGSGK
ncbi:MAG TPA: hypothetical protein VEL68_00130 [Thermodesulfobacteriota bacterium]|nr:hypothetical protein [Thermodesulfobacteriota bacterium]